MHVLSLGAAAVPFAFASIRAIATGSDFRYFALATASFIGTGMAVAFARPRGGTLVPAIAFGAVVFVVATGLAMFAARLTGARVGLGMIIVAASFGCCFAAASVLHALARASNHDAVPVS
jgi:hypothetical protein